MTLITSRRPAPVAAPPTVTSTPLDQAAAILTAAHQLFAELRHGQPLDARSLRLAMETAFGGSDAAGLWNWKDAYEAAEVAQLLFLRQFGPAMRAKAVSPMVQLTMLEKLARLLPTQTRRSEESQALQQFSTPIPLALVASVAAGLTPTDVVLEPSAGTGLLAIFAELAGATLVLNEIADTRAGLLTRLFPGVAVTRFDAAQIHDHLDVNIHPSVILMNPPFSALAHVEGRTADTALRHMASALARLTEGGRLVAITGASQSPDNSSWRNAFIRLQARGRVVFSGVLDGAAYARHGTHFDTRLTVIDRVPAADPEVLAPCAEASATVAGLLNKVMRLVPPRPPVTGPVGLATALPIPLPVPLPSRRVASPQRAISSVPPAPVPVPRLDAVELAYDTIDWKPATGGGLTEALYEGYALQSIRIAGARPHPTRLVQSAAMASVAPPKPRYRPHFPAGLVENGLLSDAQLESVIMAGEAHAGHLDGHWLVDSTFDTVSAAADDAEGAVRFRRGWFLGDGAGAGKGRQVAGVLLDNWLKGRRRALWVSKSDKLIEDAQRDWAALGQERLQITPLSRFRQGTPIRLAEGILFTTYATLRSGDKEDKASRVRQIVDWLGILESVRKYVTTKTDQAQDVGVFSTFRTGAYFFYLEDIFSNNSFTSSPTPKKFGRICTESHKLLARPFLRL